MAEVTGYTKTQVDTLLGDKADALGPDDNYVTDEEKTALANLGTAAAAAAEDFAPAGSGAYPVQQVTLTADLAYTLPVGAPADQVIGVVFTQPEQEPTGYTVTYDALPVTVALAAGASTVVELHPVAGGYVVRYPASGPTSGVNTGDQDLSGYVPTSRTVAGKALTGDITLAAADLTDHTEATQDVVGAMVAQAGGTYDDGAGSITLPPAFDAIKLLFLPTAVGNYIPPFILKQSNGGGMQISTTTANSTTFVRTIRVVSYGTYTYDRVSIGLVTPATDAGSIFAIALYTNDGAFVKELGTCDATSAAGQKDMVINETLSAGIHCLGIRFMSDTTAGTNPALYSVAGAVLGEQNSFLVNGGPTGYAPITSCTAKGAWPTQLARTSTDILSDSPQIRISLRRSA